MEKLIDKSKLYVGTKLSLFVEKIKRDTIVTITYSRLNVIFYTYDEFPDWEESWLPTGSYLIEKATIVDELILKNNITFCYNYYVGKGTIYACKVNSTNEIIVLSHDSEIFAKEKALTILKSRYNLNYHEYEINFEFKKDLTF